MNPRERGVALGNTLTDDPFPDLCFDYLLANPPFGVDWKAEKKLIDRWPNFRGYKGIANKNHILEGNRAPLWGNVSID